MPFFLNFPIEKLKNDVLMFEVARSVPNKGITNKASLNLLVTKKLTPRTHYALTGNRNINLAIFDLLVKLPMLQKELRLLFTQNVPRRIDKT